MAYRIASLLTGNRQAGLWAALLLAIWPSSIHYTGLAASEPLSLALFTAVFWTYLEADRRAGNASAFAWAGVCGLLIGFGALVKPQMQMFPVLLFLAWLASPGRKAAKAAHIAIALLAMLCAIAPWSYRNYKLFHHFLAISSNGGDVFYRANNPLATGDFTPVGERSLDPYLDDELEWNRMGFAWGKEWIRSHPVAFVKLSFQKVAHFLGDDASGAYWTLQRGHGKQGAGYLAWVIFSDAFWVGIWILALAGVAKFRSVIADSDHYGLMLWMALFFVTAHSIFESHSRYHQPMLGLLAVLAALGLVRSSPEPAPPVSA
jgi:4-amino-4-deoxy-L-arabinose transferase-like glycosyltransferase